MKSKASFCGTKATRAAENRSRLNPAGGLCPAWTEPPPSPFRSTHAKRSQTQNRTFHLLFKPDILTCYQQAPGIDGVTFDTIEESGREGFLNLR